MDAAQATTADRRAATEPIVVRPRFVVQTVGWVVLGIAALLVVDGSRHTLELILLAVVIALLLRAPIAALGRRVPRWAAITLVILAAVTALGAVLAIGTVSLGNQVKAVASAIDERLSRVDPDSALGEFIVEGRVAERIEARLDRLPSQVLIGAPDPAEGARLGLEALLVVVLAVYALANGPALVRALGRGGRSRRWIGVVGIGVAAGAEQVRRLLAAAVVNGLLGLGVAYATGLPGTAVLAIWVGVWSVVPVFGPLVGYAPLIVLASLDGWPRATIVAVLAAVFAVGSWYLDRRWYATGGTRLGPLGLAIALVVGLQFSWLAGPLVTIFVGAAALSTLAEVARRRDARTAADVPEPARTEAAGRARVWYRLHTRSAGEATAIVVGLVALIVFVRDLAPVPVWVIVGVTLAIAVEPLVDWLAEHTPLGREAALGTVIVGLLAAVAAMMIFAVPSIAESIRDLDEQVPKIGADLERLPIIGDELAERGVAERLQTTVEEIPQRLASDPGPIEATLRSVGDGLLATFWVLLITVTAVLDGQRARRGLRALVPRDRRERFDVVDGVARRVVARYAVGSVVIAAIAGFASFAIAITAGVPLAPLIGLWTALTNFIPQVGGYLGAVPLVVLAFTTGTTKGLIVFAVYLIYMQVENRVIQPLIISKAVDVPPFVAMVAVLVAGAAVGVVGAILVTPLIAVALALRGELRPADVSASGNSVA